MEIIVKTTPGELIEKWLWEDACKLLGISEWAVNEGQLNSDEVITLTEEQAKTIGLIR